MKKRRYKYQKSIRIKRKKPLFKRSFFWPAILAFVCLIGFSYFFFLSPFFQIEEINISGENKVSRENIFSKIEDNLGKQILFFKTKSVFLINTAQMRGAIMDAFPQIGAVSFNRQLPETLEIKIKERQAVAVWCSQQCYLIDETGFIFEESAVDFEFLEIEHFEQPLEAGIGEKVIETNLLSLILNINIKLEKIEVPTIKASVVSQERVNFKIQEGWEIYLNLKNDIDWQVEKLALVLEKEISPQKRNNLEYIDLRFTRVYYK